MPTLFANIPSEYIIYFLYGSAFLFLSFSIFTKDMNGSELTIADSLSLLGLFGLSHGIHELVELYPLIEGDHLSLHQIFHAKLLSAALLILSFIFLLQFGISLLEKKLRHWPVMAAGLLMVIWLHHAGERDFSRSFQFLGRMESAARYLLCMAGSLLTAYGLIAYSREISLLSRPVSRNFRSAGITFIFYGIFAGLFVSRFDFIDVPFAVQLLRGAAGTLIAFFVNRALNIFDIETRKRIEAQTRRIAQTEKLTSLGLLAAGIAHEINNPLTNASLGIQTLKTRLQADADSQLVERLDAVERNIDRASEIAQELLQFSHQKEFEFHVCDINRILTGAQTLLGHRLKGISVQNRFNSAPEVIGDPGKLEQVFVNILCNAIEALMDGGSLLISTENLSGRVRIRIRDTGSGIPEKNIGNVFDPFFTTKELGKGTGLGLSICYGIIQRHHGSIEVQSKPGSGTTVTVLLPTKEAYEKNFNY